MGNCIYWKQRLKILALLLLQIESLLLLKPAKVHSQTANGKRTRYRRTVYRVHLFIYNLNFQMPDKFIRTIIHDVKKL